MKIEREIKPATLQDLQQPLSDQNRKVAQIKRFYLEGPNWRGPFNHPMGITAGVENVVHLKFVDKIYEIVKTVNSYKAGRGQS